MSNPLLTKSHTVHQLYRHPVGRDVIDKLLLQTGLPRRLVYTVEWMKLKWLERLLQPITGPGMMDVILDLVNSERDRPLKGRAPHPTPCRHARIPSPYPPLSAGGRLRRPSRRR